MSVEKLVKAPYAAIDNYPLQERAPIWEMWLHWSAAQRRLWRQGDTRRRMFA